MDKLFGKTVDMLSTMLDYQARSHKLITSNIANIDTPGYKPRDLIFQKELNEQMEGEKGMQLNNTHEKHLPRNDARVDQGEYEVVNSGEVVSIDNEMVNLAENNLMYNLSVELLARKFKGLNTVLREAK